MHMVWEQVEGPAVAVHFAFMADTPGRAGRGEIEWESKHYATTW
jgi:hypothetical protein